MESISSNHLTPDAIISDQYCLIFTWIFFCFLLMMISIAGAVSNIINSICFVKQGLKDSVNINFLALAIADFGSLVTMMLACIGYIPTIQDISQSVDVVEMLYLTVGWPHVLFTRVTGWITALITLERCLCITSPLKVKVFITPKRVVLSNLTLYLIVQASVLPIYYTTSYGWKFSPERNRTILGLVFTADREQVESIAFTLNHVILPFTAFIVVSVATIILVINLHRKSKWRQKSASNNASDRDQKLGRTIVVIATVFIVSYIPMCLTFVAAIFVPGMSLDGYNKNLMIVCVGIAGLFEVTNSSVNIFIYYIMSSKYRQVFNHMFHAFQEK